ncbi:porphobilinogen synthase, partial [bacterium]|nr:porphobilinogen synthase [bacterium]
MKKPIVHRPRRLRMNARIRDMVRETQVTADDLIYPMFVTHEENAATPIQSMPGCYQYGLGKIGEACQQVENAGVPAVILFGLPDHKDAHGSSSFDPHGVIAKAIEAIKKSCSSLVVMTDVCLCEYTSHGHCGVLDGETILNDETVDILCKEAVMHANAGSDVIAPSDMMDGRIGALRDALDDAGHIYIP